MRPTARLLLLFLFLLDHADFDFARRRFLAFQPERDVSFAGAFAISEIWVGVTNLASQIALSDIDSR